MKVWQKLSLIHKIILGMMVGAFLGVTAPQLQAIATLGNLFVGALKAIAPILVFFIVMSALAQHEKGQESNMKLIVFLYLLGTLAAAFVGVIASFLFPLKLTFGQAVQSEVSPPQGVAQVINTLLMNLVDNPVNALSQGNFIGILFWAIIFGIALRAANPQVKALLETCSEATSQAVRWVIACAPLGILGLVFQTVSTNGLDIFTTYGSLLAVLIGSMAFVVLVVNPLIVFSMIHENPFPLVFKCLRDSAITAFFTRSSAANIPVNMQLCEELGLDEDNYSVSIPLGATINMAGAAITISVLTLAACNTLGIKVDFITALILSVLSAISACGASGVAGGSLLLIPVACSLFGIPTDIAMQVVGVGFIIGVIQDSCETAVNSSTDALFTAAAEFHYRKQEGLPIWPHVSNESTETVSIIQD
ncbi:serine/threonine transporter SstT [Vaginisenegalia massiliensis]|uniref:serine/threonine transporter SstT n=1 Tax=Vaginisenegalia massiliensis TaxID=2058294 RepID=UPI000F52F091|nr:serine/threonine transporter SstT [Vaginisenegalia massiliensis]